MDKTKLAAISKHYQSLSDFRLPKYGYNILQLDGNAFHTFTKGFEKPFDARFVNAMNETAIAVLKHTSNAKFAFVQSDEINIFMRPDEEAGQEAFFSHRIQKIASLTASRASVHMTLAYPEKDPALFDARFFNVPDAETAALHFLWRQRDCTKNSIQSVGQAHFSQKQLHNKNSQDIREMLQEAEGVKAWEDYPTELKTGRLILQVPYTRTVEYVHKRTKETHSIKAEGLEWAAIPAERFEESRMLDKFII